MEIFGLPFSAIGDVGATALVTLFVLALLTGRLRPQRAIDEVRQDRDARVAEAKEQYIKALDLAKVWEEAFRKNQETTTELRQILNEQTELLKPLPKLLNDLMAVATRLSAYREARDGEE